MKEPVAPSGGQPTSPLDDLPTIYEPRYPAQCYAHHPFPFTTALGLGKLLFQLAVENVPLFLKTFLRHKYHLSFFRHLFTGTITI